MKPVFFAGIDLAKSTLDLALLHQNEMVAAYHIPNTVADIKELLKRMFVQHGATVRNTIYCAEDMGLFANFLLQVLLKKKAKVCMESPLRIKYSLGIQRGKTDLLDARRIAKYACLNRAHLRYYEPERPVISELRLLRSVRSRLVAASVLITSDAKMQDAFLPKGRNAYLKKQCSQSLTNIKNDIAQVEKKMLVLIRNDVRLNRLFELMTSIPHVGNIVATEILLCTNEFKSIATPKRFGAFAGIAPYRYESGTSVKGRTKVSWIGNKKMKTLLHLAALGYTRRTNTFLGRYYLRKVAEGKNKMSVLNAVRNKLVQRIYACVQAEKKFTDIED